MTGKSFLDTNVLVYAFDRSDRDKQARCQELVQAAVSTGLGVISTQVLSEFFVTVTRKVAVAMPVERAAAVCRDLAVLHVVELTTPLVLEAMLRVKARNLSYWDALIVGAARAADCQVIITEDLADGSTIDGVRIQNPFRV